MEFFKRAHVAKNNDSLPKQNKPEETVKKQLKQMLHGYKQSDNYLIKSSANIKNDFDDSSSVSGFSDINLTNSGDEADVTHETISSNAHDVSLSDSNDQSLSKSPNIMDVENDNNQNESVSGSNDSISEFHEEIQSLSEDMLQERHNNSYSESDDDISLYSSCVGSQSDGETDQSETFDADGALAARILDRLGKPGKISKKERKVRKRKVSENSDSQIFSLKDKGRYKGPYRPESTDISTEFDEIGSCGSSNAHKADKFKGQPVDLDSVQDTEDELIIPEDVSIEESSHEQSPPYISVTATDMPSQSLDEILGEYKHSTTRNLPSDTQHVVSATSNSGIFSTEELSANESQVDEDVDSLIPEIDNDVAIDDIIEIENELDSSALVNDELDLSTLANDESTLPVEESTAYDISFQSEQLSEREQSTDSNEPALNNLVRVYYGKNNCIFVLKHPAEIYIHGKVKIKSLGGTVEILGYTLQDEPCEIYAPNYNYAQYLRTVENQSANHGLFSKLTSAGLQVSEAEEIVTSIAEYDGIISLKPLKNPKLDFVENNFTVTDLFGKTKNVDNCFKKSSEMLGCSFYLSKPWKHFKENASWKQAIRYGLENQSRGIVCGGKGVGKSTFLRYYINKLLSQGPVLLIDLDPGQCELTVAGNISATVITEPLLGPNFTHLKRPDMMLNIGMINTMDNPKRYANAVKSLITHCSVDERLKNLPWIVNTMGMCNAMGLKFISLIISCTKPTFILQIDSKNPKKRFECPLYSYTIKQLVSKYRYDPIFRNIRDVENLEYLFFISHHTENSVNNKVSLAPRDERYLNFLAYFGELLHGKNGSLLDIVPYEVNLKDLSIGANVKIDEETCTKVINGKVVALCTHTRDSGVFTLSDKPLQCHGHGLIRGTDWEKGTLYIITPTPAEILTSVNALVYADWVPEVRGQEIHLPPGTAVPYRTASRYQQRQLLFAPKRRFNPLQLLKMSRSTN